MSDEYKCLHEELLQSHSLSLKELEREVQFKREKIEGLKDSVDAIDEKLDKLILKSERDDFNIDKRVTSLENTIKVLKWVLAIGLSCVGTAVAIITLMLTVL